MINEQDYKLLTLIREWLGVTDEKSERGVGRAIYKVPITFSERYDADDYKMIKVFVPLPCNIGDTRYVSGGVIEGDDMFDIVNEAKYMVKWVYHVVDVEGEVVDIYLDLISALNRVNEDIYILIEDIINDIELMKKRECEEDER